MKRRFSLEELREATAGSTTSEAFTAALRAHGWVWLRLPEEAATEADAMTAAAMSFFSLPEETKTSLGPFRRVKGQVVGYRNTGNREFVEGRVDSDYHAAPDPGEQSPAFARALEATMRRLLGAGREALRLVADDLRVSPQFFYDLIDDLSEPGRIPEGDMSAACLRVCLYREQLPAPPQAESGPKEEEVVVVEEGVSGASADAGPADERAVPPPAWGWGPGSGRPQAPDDELGAVAFGDHTDTTFITVAPASTVPGLEILDPAPEWSDTAGRFCDPEASPPSPPNDDSDKETTATAAAAATAATAATATATTTGPESRSPQEAVGAPNANTYLHRNAAGEGWVRPEAELGVDPRRDLVVFCGEFLQVLSRSRFRAAVHRVLRPEAGEGERLSMPLLIRGRLEAIIDSDAHLLPPAVPAPLPAAPSSSADPASSSSLSSLTPPPAAPAAAAAEAASASCSSAETVPTNVRRAAPVGGGGGGSGDGDGDGEDDEEPDSRVLGLTGMRMKEFHAFLELRRRRQLTQQRRQQEKERAAAALKEKEIEAAESDSAPQSQSQTPAGKWVLR